MEPLVKLKYRLLMRKEYYINDKFFDFDKSPYSQNQKGQDKNTLKQKSSRRLISTLKHLGVRETWYKQLTLKWFRKKIMNIQRVNKEGGEKGENEKNKSDKMLTIEELG